MVRLCKAVLFVLLFAAVATVPSLSQGAITQVLSSATTPSPAAALTDPLGRGTPSSSILGFLKAAQSGDYAIAAEYLQLSPGRRQSEGEQDATRLKFVMDHVFNGNVSKYNQPEGIPNFELDSTSSYRQGSPRTSLE